MIPFRYKSSHVVIAALAVAAWGIVATPFIIFRTFNTPPPVVTIEDNDDKRPAMLPSSQDAALHRLQNIENVRAYGAIVDAGVAVGDRFGTWRNDTGKLVFLTGLFGAADASDVGSLTISVGDRQMTGGFIRAGAIYTANTIAREPTLTWPGSQPVPPGEQVQLALDTAATGRFTYTVVVADNMESPPKDWPEPRWLVTKPENVVGQQSPDFETPYNCIFMDWTRNNSNANYVDTTSFKIKVGHYYVTLNSILGDKVPFNVISPDAILGIPVKQNEVVTQFIEVQTVAVQPSLVFRASKRWGDDG